MTDGCLRDIDVAVLAGGLGTRLRPVLPDAPKLLAPVDGKLMLDTLVSWLRRFGARRVVLCLGHLAERVTDHLDGRPDDGIEIVASIEPEPLGTAGGLLHAIDHLRSDPIMIMNGDSVVDADLCAFLAKHRKTGAPASILCTKVPDRTAFGTVLVENDRIVSFNEKDPSFPGPGVISAGVYILSRTMLSGLRRSRPQSLERDVFAVARPGTIGAFVGDFPFIDIGTPERLISASAFFTDHRKHF